MSNFKYVVFKENDYYVSQCLNIDISSFGKTIEEAVKNMVEAIELYYEDEMPTDYSLIQEIMVGEKNINVKTSVI
jgi:predicted RNase H-like HicB family nuclease